MHFHHPKGTVMSIGWDGKSFDPDENGVFDLPEQAAADLAAFGLIPGDPAPAEPEVFVPVSQWTNVALLAKAKEIGLELPPDIKRPDLIKAVSTALTAALPPKE
jgi:hypothetical protein